MSSPARALLERLRRTAVAAARFYLDRDRLAVTRHGYGRPTRVVPVVEAGHPAPDPVGLKGAEQALALAGGGGISALAADTDGSDGGGGRPDDPAGAFVDPTTLARARPGGLDAAAFLANNDSTGFFQALADLLTTGPTDTNVTDFRAILIDSP